MVTRTHIILWLNLHKPNAIMKAWVTVFVTGALSQGGDRQSNYCFQYSLSNKCV
nr:MAG TPA: hypothetical protein [Caudoviricetes sp.]